MPRSRIPLHPIPLPPRSLGISSRYWQGLALKLRHPPNPRGMLRRRLSRRPQRPAAQALLCLRHFFHLRHRRRPSWQSLRRRRRPRRHQPLRLRQEQRQTRSRLLSARPRRRPWRRRLSCLHPQHRRARRRAAPRLRPPRHPPRPRAAHGPMIPTPMTTRMRRQSRRTHPTRGSPPASACRPYSHPRRTSLRRHRH